MIEHLVATIALLIATHVDLKIREVPDTVSYGTIITGIIIGLLGTIITLNWWPFLNSIIGFAIGAVIGVIMYYLGQWGGGDAKLIMGLGALFGAGAFFYNFLLYLIIAGAIYGLLYGFFMAWKKRKEFKKAFHKLVYTKKVKFIRLCFQLSVSTALIISFFIVQDLFFRIFLVVLSAGTYLLFYAWLFAKALEEGCMKNKIPINKLVEGDWVLEEIIQKTKVLHKKGVVSKEKLSAIKKLFDSQIPKIKTRHILDGKIPLWKREKRINKLIENDKLLEPLYIGGKRITGIITKRKLLRVEEYLLENDFFIEIEFLRFWKKNVSPSKLKKNHKLTQDILLKSVLCFSKGVGISKAEILRLKKNKIKNILIKEGIPFVPSFLLAYICTIIFLKVKEFNLLDFF